MNMGSFHTPSLKFPSIDLWEKDPTNQSKYKNDGAEERETVVAFWQFHYLEPHAYFKWKYLWISCRIYSLAGAEGISILTQMFMERKGELFFLQWEYLSGPR